MIFLRYKIKRLICKVIGHSWDEIVAPPIMNNRWKCKRCYAVSYPYLKIKEF